ncbi:hypothetical protein H0A66_02475 [Alcaligenaceae bacterium]|nr:hypothetical protein [Alcaligenaceae bacterium]
MATISTIKKTGVYVTRGGGLAFIVDIKAGRVIQCRGYVITGTRLNTLPEWGVWTPDGRLIGSSIDDHEKDILQSI